MNIGPSNEQKRHQVSYYLDGSCRNIILALESHNLTCLSPTAVSIMGVAFIGTVIFCIGLIVYLTKDYFRM